MRVARNIALFGAVGLVLSLIVAGLASVAPSIFGWLTVPFWLMPALANVGAHDLPVLPLFLLSGGICYSLVAFMVFRLARLRHRQR
jgi:hypothetical protein